jgi:M6 family metalloprotease-like protein
MKTKILSLIAFMLLGTITSFAVPACPYPIQYKQPDGSSVTIILKGDERVNWATSPDGYSLLLNKKGFYEYASKNAAGDLNLSGVRVHNEAQRTPAEVSLLKILSKDLRYSREQINLLQQFWKIDETNKPPKLRSDGGPQRSATGSVRAPLILVGFQGKPFTKTKHDFELLMNQPNYTHIETESESISGSVYDYFRAASYGQLDYQVDIFGPYTLSHEIAYYDDSSGGDPRAMAYEAAMMAHGDGCDFSNYDLDNDGVVDGIHIIFAGYDQAAGAPAGQAIWSHAWALWDEYALNLDNKQVYRYSCSTELRGTSGTNITYIGVIAHELSHVFGLPDLYDTDYSNSDGQSIHLNQWDIMASGSWNDRGRTPAYHSAWCRDYLGWVPAIELTGPENITLPDPAVQGAVYRINTSTPNEYFLLENRQQQSWDSFIPSSGLLIYHVDENYSGWNNNCINCVPSHRGLYVKQAGGGVNSNNTNRTTDPYPSGGNTTFTDYSVPHSKSWAGQNTGKPITNIIHNTTNRTVSFRFMETVSPVSELEATVEGASVSLIWVAPDEETLIGYSIYRNNQLIYTISNKATTTFTQNDVLNGNYNYCVAALYDMTESSKECIEVIVTEGNDNACPPVRNLQVIENTTVSLNWNAPFTEGWISHAGEENGISYKIYRDGELIGTSQTTNYTDVTTTVGNTYSYCVSVQYNDGCESEQVCAEVTISDYAIKFYEAAVDPASDPLDFVQSSSYPWIAGENYVLSSNQYVDNTSSWFGTTLTHTNDISLSFDWMVDSEVNFDFLRFYINDQLQEEISGGNGLNFTTKTYELAPGTYALKWEYSKDYSVSNYTDEGYVRDIKVIYEVPLDTPTLWTDKEEINFFFVNTPYIAERSVLVKNKGLGDLIIDRIENIAPPFSVQYSNDPILYNNPVAIQFSFAPGENMQGLISQSIDIISSGGDKTIVLKGYANFNSIHVETPGTLKDLIPEEMKQQITELKLTGSIDARDFRYLHDFSSLYNLDISEVSIIAYEGEEGSADWYAYYPENEVPTYAFFDVRNWQPSGISSIQLPHSAISIGLEAFGYCTNLISVQLPENLVHIQGYAFYNCNSLPEIDLPISITVIEDYAFAYCTNLQEITVHWLTPLPVSSSVFEGVNKRNCTLHIPEDSLEAYLNANVWKGFLDTSDFDIDENGVLVGYYGAGGDIVIPEGATAIHDRVFWSNGTITSVVIPLTVTSIGYGAFWNCYNLSSIHIPGNITFIGNEAFSYCYNLQSIHYQTYSPVTLGEYNYTFDGIDRFACELHVPDKASDIFHAANIWKDFNIIGSPETVNDIYIHNQVTFTNNVRPEGQPPITITPTGSLRIQGVTPLETDHFQMRYRGKAGWYWEIDEWGYGYDYYLPQQAANLINESVDIQAENVSLRLELWGNTWYYLSFPFDVKIADIQMDPGVSFVFRKYDGDMRATVGFGNSWQNVSDTLRAGVGYAFRCNQDVYNLILPATLESGQNLFASASQVIPLQEYDSGYASDRSWNLIGNPYPSYFDLRGIEFTAPVTVWKDYGYAAYSPVDDEYVLSPFQAFFVQKPNDLNVITFIPEGRMPNARSRMETASRVISNTNRKLIDVYLSNGKFEDKSRVVINPEASQEYELHCDAAKFMSPDNRTPQLYSIDASNTSLAINERPLADGIIHLGYYAGETGSYTIRGNSAWNEGEVLLIDNYLNRSVDLNDTDYIFDSEQGSFNNRFELHISQSTGVTEKHSSGSSVYGQQGKVVIKTETGNPVAIYMLDGRKIKELRTTNAETTVALSKGVYIVQINNETFKIIIY